MESPHSRRQSSTQIALRTRSISNGPNFLPPVFPLRPALTEKFSSNSINSRSLSRQTLHYPVSAFDDFDFGPTVPRAPVVGYSPPIPASAQWLLQSPPPPSQRRPLDSPPQSSSPERDISPGVNHLNAYSSDSSSSSSGSSNSYTTTGTKSSGGFFRRGISAMGRPLMRLASKGALRSTAKESVPPVPSVEQRLRKQASDYGGMKVRSSSSKSQLPKDWDEYRSQYAEGKLDMNDPPTPPRSQPPSLAFPSPSRTTPPRIPILPAPVDLIQLSHPSPVELQRQRLLSRLDLFGQGKLKLAIPASPVSSNPYHQNASPMSVDSTLSYSTAASSLPSLSTASNPSTAPSSPSSHTQILAPSPLLSAPTSIQNHPLLLSLVGRVKQIYSTQLTMITILKEDQQVFLASEGLPDSLRWGLPRCTSFCSHTVLNGEEGMVVLDTRKDWRFKDNVLSVIMNARFYAGAPIFSSSKLGKEGRIAIGTICVMDEQPREAFTKDDRAQLFSFAHEASKMIESFLVTRSSHQVPTSPKNSRSKGISLPSPLPLPSPAKSSPSRLPIRSPKRPTLTKRDSLTEVLQAPERQWKVPPTDDRRWSVCSDVPAPNGPLPLPPSPTLLSLDLPYIPLLYSPPDIPLPALPNGFPGISTPGLDPVPPTLSPSPLIYSPGIFAQLSKSPQQIIDKAVSDLCLSLGLSLVYLVALTNLPPPKPPAPIFPSHAKAPSDPQPPTLTLLTSYNLPGTQDSHPTFDPWLHLTALLAPEGGLLYKNPDIPPVERTGYSSGMLIPVLLPRRNSLGIDGTAGVERTAREREGKGWVLCGYTKDTEMRFGQRELEAFIKCADGVEIWLE